MKNLIRLELKKINLKSHLTGLVIANIMILCLSIFISTLLKSLTELSTLSGLPNFDLDTMTLASMLVRAVLIVWEAVFISLFIIEEYRNHTMGLLFTYPVNRTRLIAAKLVTLCGLILAFHVCSAVFQNICIAFLSRQYNFVTYSFDGVVTWTITTISSVLLGLFPLFIGMAKKSTIATIVSSLIIVSIASNSQVITAGVLSIPLLAVVLGVTGAVFAAAAIKTMITSDLSNQ